MIKYEYSLSDNYPNPFNPSTKIKYRLKEDGLVNLAVYNVLGEKIDQLIDEFKSKGNYSVNFNASGLSSGVYIYKLNVNNFTSIKKMVITK